MFIRGPPPSTHTTTVWAHETTVWVISPQKCTYPPPSLKTTGKCWITWSIMFGPFTVPVNIGPDAMFSKTTGKWWITFGKVKDVRPIYCPNKRRPRSNVYQGSPPPRVPPPTNRKWCMLFGPFSVLVTVDTERTIIKGPPTHPFNTTVRLWIACGQVMAIQPIYCPH